MNALSFESWLGAHFRSADDFPTFGARCIHLHEEDSQATPETALSDADHALVEAIRNGDTEQFTAWYTEMYDDACRFAYRFVGDGDRAGDVVQDVFFSIWERRAEWKLRTSPRAYALSAIRRRALYVLRHERVISAVATESASHPLEIPGRGTVYENPESIASELSLHEVMRRQVAQLPERQRTALTLRWEYGMSNAEIAHTLGIGEAAVSRVLSRATVTLRKAWDKLVD